MSARMSVDKLRVDHIDPRLTVLHYTSDLWLYDSDISVDGGL